MLLLVNSIPYIIDNNSEDEEGAYNQAGSWGPLVKVGIPGRQGSFRVMQDIGSDDTFWSLPADLQRISNDRDVRDIMLQRQELLGIPNVRYARDSPAYARNLQTQARENAAADENNSSNYAEEDRDQEQNLDIDSQAGPGLLPEFNQVDGGQNLMQTQWGVPFELCKKGHFAVCHEEFGDGKGGTGINIYKIRDVLEEKDENRELVSYFITIKKLVPSKKGVFVYDQSCLNCSWHLQPGNIKETKIMGWQVVYYFEKLTRGKKIPNHKKILKLAEDHKLDLFNPPERREFASVFSDDESGSETDEISDCEE